MEKLQLREKEIIETLKKLEKYDFVLIGGYAVNVYTLPRFSVDCDIVLKKSELQNILNALTHLDYLKKDINKKVIGYQDFIRYEKTLENNFLATFDILVDKVHDRLSGITFEADWIFENSTKRTLHGKTVPDKVDLRIISQEALFIMKFACARASDIRDIFMISTEINLKKIKQEIPKLNLTNQLEKIISKIQDPLFKNNLEGVYGYIDEKAFQRRKKIITEDVYALFSHSK